VVLADLAHPMLLLQPVVLAINGSPNAVTPQLIHADACGKITTTSCNSSMHKGTKEKPV